MSDLIDRQQTLEFLCKYMEWVNEDYCFMNIDEKREAVKEMLSGIPSVEPEIVRCKDCKWYELPSHKISENCVRWMKSNGILLPIKPNDYCSMAERREDGSD